MTPWQQRWLDKLTAKARRQHTRKPRAVTLEVVMEHDLAIPVTGGAFRRAVFRAADGTDVVFDVAFEEGGGEDDSESRTSADA